MSSSNYLEWKPIGVEAARRALSNGGKLFPLSTDFYSGGAIYRMALETKRGTCYLVSDYVKLGIDSPTAKITQDSPDADKVQYADRPPAGYRLASNDQLITVSDLVYRSDSHTRDATWERPVIGQNIIDSTVNKCWPAIMGLATPTVNRK